MTDTGRTPGKSISAEQVETLVWLLDRGVDRRRYRIVSRLRSVRDSDEFASLPEDLRERVRQIVAESER
jgi:predicted RNase H-like nuclease